MENILSFYQQTANQLLQQYNLTDWKFVFDSKPTNKRIGQCRPSKKEIALSKKSALILPVEECIDTIKHEIAHALTIGHAHDDVWKAKCIEIGCKPEQYADVNLDVLARFKGECPTCGHVIYSGKKTGFVCVPCCNADYHATGNSNYQKHIYVWQKNA